MPVNFRSMFRGESEKEFTFRNVDSILPEKLKIRGFRPGTNYLNSEALRIEIHEGLNVIERWNGVNDFIFFGKSGEISTNRKQSQELSVLSLHLLQNCLVYVNTLLIQEKLSDPVHMKYMTEEDFRALTPLIFNHVNPYGSFNLDMNSRIPIISEFKEAA